MTVCQIIWAFVISVIGGQLVLAPIMECVRHLYGRATKRDWFVSFASGMTERAVATALVMWAPAFVGPFVGGWTVAKFAAGWGRIERGTPDIRSLHVMALVGTTWSFAIAIAVGLWFHPESVTYFSAPPNSN